MCIMFFFFFFLNPCAPGPFSRRGNRHPPQLVNISPAPPSFPPRPGQMFWAGLALDLVGLAGFQVAQAGSRVASCKQGLFGWQPKGHRARYRPGWERGRRGEGSTFHFFPERCHQGFCHRRRCPPRVGGGGEGAPRVPPDGSSRSISPQEAACAGEDVETMRQTAKRLLAKLQEAEKHHQLEREAFERTVSQYREEAEQAGSARRRAERNAAEKEVEVEELQRLLAGMEKEHGGLLLKMKEGEAELARLRSVEGDKLAQQDRSAQLEKEVATLREKIHHLDDMLKSQQRKVRQMIEQLQNSKAVIQAKDGMIQELKERVAYLEAENLEMHDRIEHLIEKQVSRGGHSSRARSKSEYVSSKRLMGPKPLPLIRVVET
uniref:Tuftelin 1 n=1 Tax=Calidris pygmaea TaxID=425635 RepID=A0A8C3PLW2_9CHAR